MRIFLLLACCAITISAAYWAYNENYRTQAALKRISKLQVEIANEREAISVLNAEWAYLNRPERLRDLVDLNFSDLLLVPLSSDHFGETENITYPRQREIKVMNPIDVQGLLEDPAQ
jgi:hypothetical protein